MITLTALVILIAVILLGLVISLLAGGLTGLIIVIDVITGGLIIYGLFRFFTR